jgi:hypothetical protein
MRARRARAIAIVAMSLFVPTLAFAGNPQAAFKHVPGEVMAVAGVDVDGLRDSSLFKGVEQQLRRELDSKRELQQFQKATGVNLLRDVHSIVVVLPEDVLKDDDEFGLVIEADVNEAKFLSFMRNSGSKIVEKTGPGGNYYEIGGGKGALAFRGKHVILAAKKTFDRMLRKRPGRAKYDALRSKVQDKDLFAVAKLSPSAQQRLAREDRELAGLKSVAAGIDLGRGLQARVVGRFADTAKPKELKGKLDKVVAHAADDKQAKQMGMSDAIKKLQVQALATQLILSLRLSGRDVGRLTKTLAALLK